MNRRGLASLLFVMGADISEFQTELRKSTRDMQKWGRDMQKTGKSFSTYITAPVVAFGTASVMSFRNLNEAMKQVEAGIESTGGAAGYTSAELRKMATDMGRMTNTLNTDILKNVTAQMLTFTNVSGDAFEQAQMAALNLSARLDGDLKGSAIMVGKALNDPIQGLTALRRVGIQFSDDQQKVIRSMVATGNIAEAQTVILKELEVQYGGSAAAAGDGFSQMANSAKMLGQQFGELIYDIVEPLASGIARITDRIADLDDRTKKIILVAGSLLAAVGPVMMAVGYTASTILPMLIRGLVATQATVVKLWAVIAANPIGAAITLITALGAAFLLLRNRTDAASEALREVETRANQSIASQKVAVDQLLRVARDQNRSDQERIKAIRELNAISPEYLGNLSLEKITTEEATKAHQAYIQSLLQEARVKAAKEKLIELEKERLALETEGLQLGFWERTGAAARASLNITSNAASALAQEGMRRYQNRIEEIDKAQQALVGIIDKSTDATRAFGDEQEGAAAGVDALADVTEREKGILEGLNEQLRFWREQEIQATTEEHISLSRKRQNEIQNEINLVMLLADLQRRRPRQAESRTGGQDAAIKTDAGDPFGAIGMQGQFAQLQETAQITKRELSDAAKEVIEQWSKLPASIKLADHALMVFANHAGWALEEIGAALVGAETNFRSLVMSMLSGLGQIINGMLAKAIAGVIAGESAKGLVGLATAAIGVGMVKGLFNRSVPKLAFGAEIPSGYPNDTYLARLSSGERVVPQAKPIPLGAGQQHGGSREMEIVRWKRAGDALYLYMQETERRRSSV